MFFRFVIILFIGATTLLRANDPPTISVRYTDENMKIDGELNEDIWQEIAPTNDFWMYFPNDTTYATKQTYIKMAYDDDNLYVAAIAYHDGSKYVIPSLKRDFRAGGNDNITFMFDTFGDGQNCFMFGLNPAGVQREGLISGGGIDLDGFSTSWDNKWYSEVKIEEDKWIIEIQIPLSTLRFVKGCTKWRFNSYRFEMGANERSTWVNIPRNQWIFHLGYMGDMIFEKPLAKSKTGTSIIPYIIGGRSSDKEQSPSQSNLNYNIGGDLKLPITSGLNLDLTINPDFSQVEVDEQVTNIDRFEILFPERRQFFLENEDLFSGFGTNRINPFFSRRIGISKDTLTETTVQNTIYGGARLSGKINEKLRIGILSMQTARDDDSGQPSLNFGVATFQHKVGAKSNIAGIFVNRQAFNSTETDVIDVFNRVAGLDFNYLSLNNHWSGKIFLHRSFSPDEKQRPYAHGANISYIDQKVDLSYRQEYVGEGYDAQAGFIRRDDYYSNRIEANYFVMPQQSIVNRHRFSYTIGNLWKPNLGHTDQRMSLRWNVEFANNAMMTISGEHTYIYLFDDFDPTGTESTELSIDTDYRYSNIEASFRSNNAERFSFRTEVNGGQYFNGYRYGIEGNFLYRYEPYAQLSVRYAYNSFDLPHLDGLRSTLLIGPNIDLSLSKSLFINTFIQYNSQSQNTNINARLQWRFAPVSDFFLVFTNNYFTGENLDNQFVLRERNNSIIAKFTYWLNV